MASAEKTLLITSVILSWLFSAVIWFLVFTDLDVWPLLGILLVSMLFWLTPFSLLLLFSSKTFSPIAAFSLGSLGFLVIGFQFYLTSGVFLPFVYTLLGVLLLILGFSYWALRVKHARVSDPAFSSMDIFKGMGLFFTVAALFGGLLYFYSPFATRALLEPRVPEKFFEVIFRVFAGTIVQFSGTGPDAINPEAARPEIYRIINAALAELAQRYQGYIPFVFAAGAFFFLKVMFSLFKYAVFGMTYLFVKFFTDRGWLHKEVTQVPREVIKF